MLNEHDVVRVPDGREGTIIHIGQGYFLVELGPEIDYYEEHQLTLVWKCE